MNHREMIYKLRTVMHYGLDIDQMDIVEEIIKTLEQTEWVTVNSPDDYPKESGDYLTVLRNTSFHNNEYTDITSFDCDGILAEWDLKPQYKVVAWKYFESYKGGGVRNENNPSER